MHSCLARAVFLLAPLGALHGVSAQALPPGVVLGMSPDALQHALPQIERVARPPRLAGGLVGGWRAFGVDVAGLSGQQTFYFAAGSLQRVEFFADVRDQADGGAAAFERIVAWGRNAYGPEAAAHDRDGGYAAWTPGGVEVYVQRVAAPRAGVRVVHKLSQGKDASAL